MVLIVIQAGNGFSKLTKLIITLRMKKVNPIIKKGTIIVEVKLALKYTSDYSDR